MTTFESLISNHYYINLDSRNDRLISCENELKKIGLDRPNRFSAIKNEVGSAWASFSALWSFTLAYLVATFTYQLATITIQPLYSVISLIVVMSIFMAIYICLKRFGKNILTIPTQVSYY